MSDTLERMWIADVKPDTATWHKAFDAEPEFHRHRYSAYIREDLHAAVVAERDALHAELASGSFYKEADIDAMQDRIATLEAQLAEARAAVAAAYESERNQPRPEYALERIRKEARREALEDAAKVADACPDQHWGPSIAAAIRALTYQKEDSHE